VLCLRMHSNVMLRFMVKALQDPPLCSSTFTTTLIKVNLSRKSPIVILEVGL
jgi:hypothetical protein